MGRLLVVVSAAVFVDTIFFTAVTPLLPHYVSTLGLSKSGAGILVAAYPIGTLLGSLPSGMFASRFGVRAAVVTGLALMSAATLAFGFGTSTLVLDAARFAQGIGGACTWAGSLAWVASAAPPARRGAALGVAYSASVGGALFGPAVGALASRVGTGPTFAGATVAGALLIVASLTVPVPRSDESQSLRAAIRAVRDRSLLGGLWLTFLAGLAFGVVDVLAPLRMSALGASAVVIGVTFLGSAAAESAVSPFVGKMADRRGRSVPIRLAVSTSIVVSLLLPFVSPEAVLIVVLVVGLPAYGSLYVPAAALVSDGAERRRLHQGLGFGLANLAWAGGQGLSAAASGALAQFTSDVVPYVLLAAACALTAVATHRQAQARNSPGASTSTSPAALQVVNRGKS